MARPYRANPDKRFNHLPQLDELDDDVKRMIAAAVQHALVTGQARPELTGQPDEVSEVTGEAVSATVTVIRVQLTNGTTRAFQVKLTETSE
jgi:hypothetical protein